MRQWLVGASLVGLTVVLNGCRGGSPTPAPPPPGPPSGPTLPPPPPAGPCACPKSRNFVHCSACHSDGSQISCKTCTGSYTPNSDATDRKDPEQVCVTKCGAPGPKPGKPANAQGNNGVTWPTQCQDQYTKAVFFGIGDWGGMCGFGGKLCHCQGTCDKQGIGDDCKFLYGDSSPPGLPCTFVPHGAPKNRKVEGQVQKRIGDRMSDRNDNLTKAGTPPQFVLNVGDNFYPGGVDVHCGSNDVAEHTKQQFQYVWKGVYTGELTTRMEWWSVLGNHDYGGVCYTKGWDQQILYTYTEDKWLMPGQYWMRSVQYKNMKMDFFFVDGSWLDTKDGGGGQAPNHDICQFNPKNIPDAICHQPFTTQCGSTGPSNGGDCENWFRTLWSAQYKWLMKVVPGSDADWQIVVTHYPGTKALGHAGVDQIDWKVWGPLMGIDLIISGHKHFQRVFKGVIPADKSISGQTEFWDKGTVSVITGGGGGITSYDNAQDDGQDDAYGFFEFQATLEKLVITAYSHGGLEGKLIVRNTTIVDPVTKKSDDEIIKAGLDPMNLLKKREITV